MPRRNAGAMRVASGAARGIRLKGPAVAGVRPTTERVRAAIFNILEPGQVAGQQVLDLFAGTGSLGIAALSHGAAGADFVERNRRQCQALLENLARTGYAGTGRVHCADALVWLARPHPTRNGAPDEAGGETAYTDADANADADANPGAGAGTEDYGLALLDPPYGMGAPTGALAALDASGRLRDGGAVVVGHSSRLALPDRIGGLRRYDRRQYGDNAIAFYRRAA